LKNFVTKHTFSTKLIFLVVVHNDEEQEGCGSVGLQILTSAFQRVHASASLNVSTFLAVLNVYVPMAIDSVIRSAPVRVSVAFKL
jgi:hypothetical protein